MVDTDPKNDGFVRSAVAADVWLSRVITVLLVMIGPGYGGSLLDKRWGTSFLTPLGLVIGVPLGIWYLIQCTKPRPPADEPKNHHQDEPPDGTTGE